ncbi:MAG TPA: hypothetical protein PKN86_21050, partial [Candidatus Obscuribacter sp.]|nr:hypothetical protein [Candidatus Obscuribacter sp.]
MATKAVTTFSFQKMGHERNYAEFRSLVENGLELQGRLELLSFSLFQAASRTASHAQSLSRESIFNSRNLSCGNSSSPLSIKLNILVSDNTFCSVNKFPRKNLYPFWNAFFSSSAMPTRYLAAPRHARLSFENGNDFCHN